MRLAVLNSASPALLDLVARFGRREALHRAMADSALVVIKDHFAFLVGANPNPYGKRASFWPRMRRSTHAVATDREASVAMPAEVGHRYHGGTIFPTGGRKALTIPVNDKAYGHRAGEFDDLRYVPQGAGGRVLGLLVRAERTVLRKTKSGLKPGVTRSFGEVMFLLVKSVTQREDETVLPTITELATAALKGAKTYFARLLGK